MLKVKELQLHHAAIKNNNKISELCETRLKKILQKASFALWRIYSLSSMSSKEASQENKIGIIAIYLANNLMEYVVSLHFT